MCMSLFLCCVCRRLLIIFVVSFIVFMFMKCLIWLLWRVWCKFFGIIIGRLCLCCGSFFIVSIFMSSVLLMFGCVVCWKFWLVLFVGWVVFGKKIIMKILLGILFFW